MPACSHGPFQLKDLHSLELNEFHSAHKKPVTDFSATMPKQRNPQELNLARHAAYPFCAVVGQEEMKLALVLNVIDPLVGGVLLLGHRGTGKSTVVRALADLLPPISVVSRCAFHCDPADTRNLCVDCRHLETSGKKLGREQCAVPMVELPLGATEDRVCGTIDIEQALGSGVKRFEPGLLARANRGFLYIDEVNLLEDHLVDLLLDVAVTGVNRVERESISLEHPARFILIGSGNPEEGELRPQLLDRFGLFVEVRTEDELDRRVEIVERRDAFERNREAFSLRFSAEQERLRREIARARRSLGTVKIRRALLHNIAQLCSDLKVDGHRGELTITRAARALAAWERRRQVTEADVRRVAPLALRHRLRRDALEETGSAARIAESLEAVFSQAPGGSAGNIHESEMGEHNRLSAGAAAEKQAERARHPGQANYARGPNGHQGTNDPSEAPAAPSALKPLPRLKAASEARSQPKQKLPSLTSGRQQAGAARSVYDRERGRYVRGLTSKAGAEPSRVALEATLRAWLTLFPQPVASRLPRARSVDARDVTPVCSDAIRFKLFKRKPGRLFIFALDLSGSMALNRIAQAKALMLALLRESYVKRDNVAIVGFRDTSARLMLPPTRSILRAGRVLDALGVGGGTPLPAGLARALELVKQTRGRQGEINLLLFTDGRANVALRESGTTERRQRREQIATEVGQLGKALKQEGVRMVLIDTQNRFSANDEARQLAHRLGADYQILTTDVGKSAPGWQA
jgi:magnesium chelatase ATPase subunit I